MKQDLLGICSNTNFRNILESKGYAYFTKGCFNLNIIGIRRNKNNKVTNKFDDALVVIYYTSDGKEVRHIFDITTDPGKTYMNKPISSVGTAILVPNQYRGTWTIGLHQGKYKALVQVKPVKVYRDRNKDDVYDFNPYTIQEGIFGINIHKAGNNSTQVDNWSAGCQVFAKKAEFDKFMQLCQKQIDNGYGKTFTYTLINETDINV